MWYNLAVSKNFKFSLPVLLEKAKDGDLRVYGLASTQSKDLQGEVVDLRGLDLEPIKKGKGYLNFDHSKEIEDRLGVIDQYKLDQKGLYIGGYLFKNSKKANDIYNIMASLKNEHKGQVGMSIEGIIRERAGDGGKVIKKAVITGAALTFTPVNTDTYCDLVKSLSAVEFMSSKISAKDESVKKAQPQVEFTEEFFKSSLVSIFESICKLYPGTPKSLIWESIKDRLNKRYPALKEY